MIIRRPRIILRDLKDSDRPAFIEYQMDPRYRSLYDLADNPSDAHALFDLFVKWQTDEPRHNFQLGIFDRVTKRLCGCAGLRRKPKDPGIAELGIELAPSDWGRYRIALAAAAGLVKHAFEVLNLRLIIGNTASGNARVEKLARWFGGRIVAEREGPEWMQTRGWREVAWALTREDWQLSEHAEGIKHCLPPAF